MKRLRDLGAGPTFLRRLFGPAVFLLLIAFGAAASAQNADAERRGLVIELPLMVNGTEAGSVPVDMANVRALEVSLAELRTALALALSDEAMSGFDARSEGQGVFAPVDEVGALTGLDLRFDTGTAALALDVPTDQLRAVSISVRGQAV